MTPTKWDIWLVDMPYEEGIGSKKRPALVIDSRQLFILVGKMTSQPPRGNYSYEYELIDWQGAGLQCKTTLRLSKRVRLNSSAFIKKIGTMQPVDQINVRQMLQQILGNNRK